MILRSWSSFLIISAVVIVIALFASEKVDMNSLFIELEFKNVLWVMLKTLAVSFLSIISLGLMIVIALIDVLLSLITQLEFPIMSFMYQYLYLDLARGWYWDIHTGSELFTSCLILFSLAMIRVYITPYNQRKIFVYHPKGRATEAVQNS